LDETKCCTNNPLDHHTKQVTFVRLEGVHYV